MREFFDENELRGLLEEAGISYEKGSNPIVDKSFAFAVEIIRITRDIQNREKEFVLTKQLMRSGTAIGALVRESQQAQSIADFIHKLSVALKECDETRYWTDLMTETKLLKHPDAALLRDQSLELFKLLTSIIKTSKSRK